MCVVFQPDVVCGFADHRQAGFLPLSGFSSPPPPAAAADCSPLPCPGPHQQFKGRAENSGGCDGQGWAAEGLGLSPGFTA